MSLSPHLWQNCLLIAALACGHLARAQAQTRVPEEVKGLLKSIRNSQPSFMVLAQVNKGTRSYREGDALLIRVACEVDAYIYVLYEQADGQTLLLYPNSLHPAHIILARQAVQIPDPQDSFRWRVQSPFGKEVIKVIASKEPISEFASVSATQTRTRPVTAAQIKGAELELGKTTPAEWAEHDVAIETYQGSQTPETRGARRYGVFVGVSEYEFNEIYKTKNNHTPMDLWSSHRAARIMSDLLTEVGQLSDRKVLTNDEATRDNIEKAVAGWLPSVSRPGDTVVIYMAGHGLSTDKGHAAFASYDALPPDLIEPALAEIARVREEIKANPEAAKTPEAKAASKYLETLTKLKPFVQKTDGGPSAFQHVVIEHTMVTSESFGRWLQDLDGREIIVILDACHSAGFTEEGQANAAAGKGLDVKTTPLADPVLRLTAIGQKDCVLLAACGTDQEALQSYDTGIVTHALDDLLRNARGPVDIKTCHEHCKAQLAEFFKLHPEKKPYEPRLFGYTHPIYLKP